VTTLLLGSPNYNFEVEQIGNLELSGKNWELPDGTEGEDL